MQRLYYLPPTPSRKQEFCIFPSESSRNYRCYTLEDPDLVRTSSLFPELRPDEICILEAEHITLELIRQQLPEYFI